MKKIIWKDLSTKEKHEILKRPTIKNRDDLLKGTKKIIDRVRKEGDLAIKELTKTYDKINLDKIEVTYEEFENACKKIPNKVKHAMKRAVCQLTSFHQKQYPNPIKIETSPGIICERQSRPIRRIGLYIPSGTAPLPSTILMLGVPSKIAKCPFRILCTPPTKDGIDPNILYAAKLCGIKKVYKVGGAQAIAAMAYGTQSIPKVYKIYGPGNSWVTNAKILVGQDPNGASYDLPAGPSEVLVIADISANPSFVAADLLSQAEHGVDSQAIMICDNNELINKVEIELKIQLEKLSRKEIAKKALEKSFLILVDGIHEAVEISNNYAPEHLILEVKKPRKLMEQVQSAGSVFLGHFSPESVGDYASGTNHVLPTYGYAKSFSGLSVNDFMVQISFQELEFEGLKDIAETVETLAEIEGLDAHKRAVSIRLNNKETL